MRQRQLMVLAGACGVLCAACVLAFMNNVQGEANAARAEALARYGGEQVEVLVATREIAAGERVDAGAIERKLWIADLLPEGAVTEQSEIVGRTAASPILKGEAISSKRFERSQDELAIPAGKVAVSVPSKPVLAVGGAVHAGMSVDVYATGDAKTMAIVRDALVLDTSLGTRTSGLVSESSWVVLAVDPEKVQEIVAASAKSELCFVLPGEGVISDSMASASSDTSASDQSAGAASSSSSAAAAKPKAKQEEE